MARRVKYKERKDGLREFAKSYTDFGPTHYTGRKHFYGHTDKEIDLKVAAFEEELLSREEQPVCITPLYSNVVDEWWEDKEKVVSLNSVSSFKSRIKETKAVFKDIQISDITAKMILEYLESIASKNYATKGIVDRKSLINGVMNYAIRKGYISSNPCRDVPTVKGKPSAKRKPASSTDVEKIENSKNDSLISRMYYFMEYTGCRVGECVVLQQKDIDTQRHTARIYKDLAFDGQKPVVKLSAKTEAGNREVDLYDNVIEILPQYENPETFLFFPEGLPRKSPYETALRKYRKKFGISATCHQMRHTYAGIMHSAEIAPKDTQARMGHSSVKITEDIYTTIEKQHNEKVRNKANQYVMEERLKRTLRKCPSCGSRRTHDSDGFNFIFCPECGMMLS